MKRKPAPKAPTATFRPDCRDGRKDFQVNAALAKKYFDMGKIAIDDRNGGYCPIKNDGPYPADLRGSAR